MRPQEHTKIVILTDLGKIRAFRLSPENSALRPHQGPANVEEINLPTSEWNTDRPSLFPRSEGVESARSMSQGEHHGEKTEREKRRISFLAREIEQLLDKEDTKLWCLAAPSTINKRLLDQINPETREFLATNIKADLTRIKLHELEERFLNSP